MICLTGTEAECAAMVAVLELADGVNVDEVGGPCSNWGDPDLVRVYLDVTVDVQCQLCGGTSGPDGWCGPACHEAGGAS